MSFGMWVAAFVCSPLYFAIRRRWLAAIIHACLYMLAIALLISLIGAILAPVVWFFCLAHAMWDLRSVISQKAIQEQAEALAQKLQANAPKPAA